MNLQHRIQIESAEKAVLGAIILCNGDPEVQETFDLLKPHHFFSGIHQRIYRALVELRKEHAKPDILILTRYLRKKNQLNKGLSAVYLTQLADAVASSANINIHAMAIYEEYSRRSAISRLKTSILNLENGSDVGETIGKIDETITEIIDGVQIRKGRDMKTVSNSLIEKLEASLRGEMPGVDTGLPELTQALGGWRKTDLYIVAARPAMGKTDFALWTSLQAAKIGFKVGFISLEMNDTTCLERLTAMNSGYSKGQLNGTEPIPTNNNGTLYNDLKQTIQSTAELGVMIQDMGSANIAQIESKARKLKREGCNLLVIDYLGLISIEAGKNRNDGLGDISRALKTRITKDLDIPVIALHQLSRKCESTPDKRPLLSHLRDSGNIEQDASGVVFLYRPEYYGFETDENGDSALGLCELIIAKNRHGLCRTVKTKYVGSKGIFEPWRYEKQDFAPTSHYEVEKTPF